uniref:hypothetical protein n=1 Tax=Clostridium saccharoperbutylacetonicum TaxID=36745 RepID=UPI000686A7BE
KIKKCKFDKKYIVVFGANLTTEFIFRSLSQRNIYVDAVVDNDISKQGEFVFGVKICSPENGLKEYRSNAIILIASKYYGEMVKQLESMNYERDKHIIKIIDISEVPSKSNIEQKNFDDNVESVKRGLDVYIKIINKYGDDVNIFMMPLTGTGDMYLAGTYLKEYIENNNIKNYVVTVIKDSCKNLCEWFNIEKVEKLDIDESDALVKLSIFIGKNNINISILHYQYFKIHTGILNNCERNLYEKVDFFNMFKYCTFNRNYKQCIPKRENDNLYVRKLFEDEKLEKGNTVILSPYAQTFFRLPNEFWTKLAKKLIINGYIVCTNSAGESEPIIEGTKSIFFPLKEAYNVIEYAGYFVGLRSGFCDIVSETKAKKVVLYQESLIFPNAFKFFSLKDISNDKKITEIKYTYNDDDKIINQVLFGLGLVE